MNDLDAATDTRFELLSAYLDDEVSYEERQQVETWLATDSAFHQQYLNLCRLQYGLRSMPNPQAALPVEQAVEQVLARASRKPSFILWGTVGVATAAVIGVITSLFSGNTGLIPQTALDPSQSDHNSNTAILTPSFSDALEPSDLMIALEHPPVDVPATAAFSAQKHTPPTDGSEF